MKIKFLTHIIILFGFLTPNVFEGYTLYTGDPDYTTYLIDNDENVINEWYADCQVASMAYLQPDSTLIYPCKQREPIIDPTSASGGRIIHYDWDGTILWDWVCDWEYQLHHDIQPTPNGTILAIAKEDIDGFMPDVVLEIEPDGMYGANLVWVWKVSEHMGELDNPYTFYEDADYHTNDWNHFNAVSLNEFDEILLSSRNWCEIYVIAYNWGDGDILYRWGNPENYGRGDDNDKMLEAQHGVNEIPVGYPGGENIILFNNNSRIGMENDTSEVIEFRPPDDYYIEDGEAWGPTEPIWTFRDDFYAPKQSGAFRLPNGNTFVTVSSDGYMFEVTYDKEIVWEHYGSSNTFRAQKYGLDYLTLYGDINGDGSVDVIDIVMVINYILDGSYITEADVNEDGVLNILDIVTLITFILGV
jgi:hypothetical protein